MARLGCRDLPPVRANSYESGSDRDGEGGEYPPHSVIKEDPHQRYTLGVAYLHSEVDSHVGDDEERCSDVAKDSRAGDPEQQGRDEQHRKKKKEVRFQR